MKHRLLLVEDHPVVATGLQLALRARGFEVEEICGPTASDVIDFARTFEPHLVLLDLRLGREVGHGADLIPALLATGAEVLVVTAETDELTLGECIQAGAAGWVGKDAFLDDLVHSVEDVLAGRPLMSAVEREALLERVRSRRASLESSLSPFDTLTSREGMVLHALGEGLTAEEIAETHFVSISTVRSQIRAILLKLGVRSQLAAVVQANRLGWIPENMPNTVDLLNSEDEESVTQRDA